MSRGVAIGGFMGSGKSTVGAWLATHLGIPFHDLDREIEMDVGMSIAAIFDQTSESAFRRHERRVLERFFDSGTIVLALGGGTLHQADNLARIRMHFFLVTLSLPLDEIRLRLGSSDDHRPLWNDADALLAARASGYAQADAVVDVGGLSVEQAGHAVRQALPW